jgi:hypothetical protein
MEYVVVRAVRPTFLNLQLPQEVGEILQYDAPEALELRGPGRGLAFLSRVPGVLRVVSAFQAREVLGMETLGNRYIAQTRPSHKLVFNLPQPVQQYLGLKVESHGPESPKTTDDVLIWFVPAPEYYEFRAQQRTRRGWTGPTPGGIPHVYLARSLLPLDPALELMEKHIETVDWRPRLEHVIRPRAR